MTNVVTLHADKRWKAIIEYRTDEGTESVEHYFEEISDLHFIIERGPYWNLLIRCTVTLSRADDGEEQNSVEKALRSERSHQNLRSGVPGFAEAFALDVLAPPHDSGLTRSFFPVWRRMLPAATNPPPAPAMLQFLMAMRFTCDCAFSVFGNATVNTPFLKRASTSSSLTS